MESTRVRRLALVTAPVSGESFASWIDRMAVDMALPPGRVADALGVSGAARAEDGTPLLFGVLLAPSVRAAVHAATGVGPRTLDAMHLSVFDGTVLDLRGLGAAAGSRAKVKRTQWALFGSSRACPQCLAESGGVWRQWWKLGMAVACPVHATLLRMTVRPAGWRFGVGRPRAHGCCRARCWCRRWVNGRVMPSGCDQRLDTVLPDVAPPWLIEVQAAYVRAADGATLMLGDRRLNAAEWFACLRAVVAMTRAAAACLALPPEVGLPDGARQAFLADATASWRQLPGTISAGSRPRTVGLTAALLAFAHQVVLAQDRAGLVEAIRPIAEALAAAPTQRRQRGNGNSLLRGVFIPAPIEQARLLAVPRRVGVVAHLGPFAQSPAGRPALLQYRHVPQVVAESDYRELIAVFLPGTLPRTGRRYAALALARLCGASSWKDAVSALGIPPRRAGALGGFASFRIGDPPAFWQAVAVLAVRLERRGPVDYQARRVLLADLVVVSPPVWRQVCAGCGVVATRQRARNAAGWLWTELTGGYWEDAPALQEANWPSRPAAWPSLYRRFARTIPAALAAGLVEWGTEMVRSPAARNGDCGL